MRGILIIFIIGYLILLWFYHTQTRSYAISEAEKQMQDILINHRAVHAFVEEVQKPVIYQLKKEGKLYEEFFAPELLSFTYIARRIKEYANLERGQQGTTELYFKLAANNPRNAINKADPFESHLLQRFNDDWELKSYREVISANNNEQLYFAMPIGANKPSCLRCHSTPDKAPKEMIEQYGDQAGFQEQTGDIRAMISIRIPLARHLADAERIFYLLALITFGVLFAIFLSIRFFSVRLQQAHQELADTNHTLNDTNHHLASTLDELSHTQTRLKESEKMASIGRMVTGLAHEINTPLGIAVGAASHVTLLHQQLIGTLFNQEEVSEEELQPLLDKLAQSAQLTQENVERAATLVRRVRSIFISQEYSQLNSFALDEVINKTVAMAKIAYNERLINFDLQLEPITVTANQDSIVLLLNNLIENSVVHGFHDMESTITGTITIHTRVEAKEVIMEYSDNGCGMTSAMIDKAFEPFVTSGRGTGMTGLGLYFCHSLLHGRMGGSIELNRSITSGFQARIHFPVTSSH